jgi:bacterioferritin
MAKVWRKESIEEMEHADKFTDRILFLDGFPNMQVLDPLRIGQNVREIIECDLASEIAARALYQEARPTAMASRTMSAATCSRA